jgi:RNA polymerase sigma-70 factor (ECF subfamily)
VVNVEATDQEAYEQLRPLAFSIAYRMVGSVSEAEDLVQEALLRFHRASESGEAIASPRAYLSAIATRLAIDHLRSARVRRETYVGPWLPEPLLTDPQPGPEEQAEVADSLSQAFLVLLEKLTPVERAVFLLREVFGHDYSDIASTVGRSEDNCRQIAARARRHVEAERPRFDADRRQREELAARFADAAESGDTEALKQMLAADAVLYSDGGGKALAARKPIYGADRTARFLVGIARQRRRHGVFTQEPVWVNGQPGRVQFDPAGRVFAVLTVDVADGLVQTVRIMRNPDKLRHIPGGDVTEPQGHSSSE